jgi:hypothetical protein
MHIVYTNFNDVKDMNFINRNISMLEYENPLLGYFMSNSGVSMHKWIHYFDIYHQCFSKYRGKKIVFLEIGVQNGGDLRMWRKYFGEQAKIIGIDIDPNCKMLEKEGFEIWIGDQADPVFWAEFCQKNPHLDIVLDDGGHTMEQQITSLISLFPILNDSGTYLCEDTHTSYFATHGGGLKNSATFLEAIKEMIDEMHAWYHAPLGKIDDSYIANHLYSIAVYDSIVVLEKRRKNAPLVLARGHEGHIKNPPAMSYIEMRRAFGVAD